MLPQGKEQLPIYRNPELFDVGLNSPLDHTAPPVEAIVHRIGPLPDNALFMGFIPEPSVTRVGRAFVNVIFAMLPVDKALFVIGDHEEGKRAFLQSIAVAEHVASHNRKPMQITTVTDRPDLWTGLGTQPAYARVMNPDTFNRDRTIAVALQQGSGPRLMLLDGTLKYMRNGDFGEWMFTEGLDRGLLPIVSLTSDEAVNIVNAVKEFGIPLLGRSTDARVSHAFTENRLDASQLPPTQMYVRARSHFSERRWENFWVPRPR